MFLSKKKSDRIRNGVKGMLQYEELKQRLTAREEELKDLAQAIGYKELEKRLAVLQEKASDPNFWNNLEASQKNQQESGKIKAKLDAYDQLKTLYDDTVTLIELADEEEDESAYPEALADCEKFENELDSQKLTTLLTGEYDSSNAILTFHAGAGGTEAQDWAQMLYRMYTRWTERHDFRYKILD